MLHSGGLWYIIASLITESFFITRCDRKSIMTKPQFFVNDLRLSRRLLTKSYSVIHKARLHKTCILCKIMFVHTHRVSKNCANLFLSELRQIFTDFDNFSQKYGNEAKIMRGVLLISTSSNSRHHNHTAVLNTQMLQTVIQC